MQSSSRNGATVRLLGVHTTEGIMSAIGLREFFNRADAQGSSHASADSTGLLLDGAGDGYVDHARAAWTLRSGNPVSENIELCGFAGWKRPDWLARPKLLDAAARWLARRAKARNLPPVKLPPAAVLSGRGIIGHHDWTVGAKDGSHWDPGPDFPWDIVIPLTEKYLDGTAPKPTPEPEDDEMAGVFVTDGNARPWWLYDGMTRRYVRPGEPQILVDLGLVKQNMVRKVAPGVLAAIPRSDVDGLDETEIARQVTEAWAKMDAERRAKEEAHELPGELNA